MSRPLVSAIVTAYHRPAYLAEAIESVFAQTVADVELIVVEDGSHEGEIIARAHGDRVRYAWQRNQGPAAARNAGVTLARGEWLAFLDDDDRWMPTKLARQLALGEQIAGLGVVHTDFLDLVDGVARSRRGRLASAEVPSGWVTGPLFLGYFGLPSTLMVRRELVERVGGFNPARRASDDYDLLLRLSRLTPFGYLAEALTVHRLHAGSHGYDERAVIDDTLAVLEDFLAWCPAVRAECGGAAVSRRLADLHARSGRLALWADDLRGARRHLAAAWWLAPGRPDALARLAGASLPRAVRRWGRELKAGLSAHSRALAAPRRTNA